jgi:hypothetical protein
MILQLPIETANQILGYLGTRPYQEVFQIIQALQEAAKPTEASVDPEATVAPEALQTENGNS